MFGTFKQYFRQNIIKDTNTFKESIVEAFNNLSFKHIQAFILHSL